MIFTIRPDSTTQQRAATLNEWYRKQLRSKLPPLFERWESVIGVHADEVKIKDMLTKWGTCNTTEIGRPPYISIYKTRHRSNSRTSASAFSLNSISRLRRSIASWIFRCISTRASASFLRRFASICASKSSHQLCIFKSVRNEIAANAYHPVERNSRFSDDNRLRNIIHDHRNCRNNRCSVKNGANERSKEQCGETSKAQI